MESEFRTTSAKERRVSAIIAAFAVVLVAGSIYGLAQHYTGSDAQMASVQSTPVA